MNIGASSPTDYGNYYQYGKGSAQYADTSTQSKYTGTEDPLATSADTAAQVWGGSWHMPTSAQCQELIDNCTWTWVTIDGINGYIVSRNGKIIFLPAAGYWSEGSPKDVGSEGHYWTSTPHDTNSSRFLYFRNDYNGTTTTNRKWGNTIRPVVG
jgi:hypothetical protein